MHHFKSTILALAALAPAALADFLIYVGNDNSVSEGGSTSVSEMFILSGEPSCDDINNYHSPFTNPNNDASSGGWACDGCDYNAPADWIISRFEFYNGEDAVGSATDSPYPILNEATGSTTLYGTGNGGYDLHDEADNIIGTCDRPSNPDDAYCSEFIASQDLTHIFTCYTDLYPNDRTKTG